MPSVPFILEELGVSYRDGRVDIQTLPFSRNDLTGGSESELQAVVCGDKSSVDLPIQIEQSNYYANVARRIAAGDTSHRAITALDRYLNEPRENVWENSWVRFPGRRLSPFAWQIFRVDLLADKRDHRRGERADANRFRFQDKGETWLRFPVSYLLKLSLAEVIGSQPDLPRAIRTIGIRLLDHFLNDNSSPETFSFHVSASRSEATLGEDLAREKAKRFLFSQLLVEYANQHLGLSENGQKAMIYFAPHPPVRQEQLNDCISDTFYRELFMSPCLSGWDDGEAKHAYMKLCHQVLSRSQLNAVAKLREAGIILNNLVVLPNVSNVSLANNGTHVSIGSRKLTAAMSDGRSNFGDAEEKYIGDLTIKIVEHFLPLFVGTYSAAPYRLDFADFHPEKLLGFLPHELDYTHLRMIWRRWRKKAELRFLGCRFKPLGPQWIDHPLSRIFRLRGDWVPDFRLVDYLVSVMSTERSPAFDGKPGNAERLKQDLADLGVFDAKMSLYVLYRLREFRAMGFCGFEGRYYSVFDSFRDDFARAVDIQTLVTALALKYQAEGRITHAHIPDEPFVESERRQIFFGAAIGIPTFFVHNNTTNEFLRAILARTTRTRASRRYPGYLRVYNDDYRKALLQTLREDAADLIEMFGLTETISDLSERLADPTHRSACARLTRGILADRDLNSPMKLPAEEFNLQAESFYRDSLRWLHLSEAFEFLINDLRKMESSTAISVELKSTLQGCLRGRSAVEVTRELKRSFLTDLASEDEIVQLLNLMLVSIHHDLQIAEQMLAQPIEGQHPAKAYDVASVY